MGTEIEQLKQQLAASQAREVQLLKALNDIAINSVDDSSERTAREAIAIPFDSTTLEAMIAKAGEVMQIRCENTATRNGQRRTAEAIRAIPDVSLEDLQK